jgi:hypothetical protein
VFAVLTANLVNVFGPDGPPLHLHNFGLGERDETGLLTVPQHNQGGAFIAGPSNAYDADVLHDKRHSEGGVRQVSVAVRRGRDVFRDIFAALPAGGLVVKIDTEGFEQTIMREIAAAMPDGARIAIVFENLQAGFDAPAFLRALGVAGSALKLTDNVAGTRSRLGKEIAKLTRGKVFRLTDQPADWAGTVVLLIEHHAGG